MAIVEGRGMKLKQRVGIFVAWFRQRASKRVFEWGVKQAPREAPDSECWGAQFWTLAQSKYISERTQKWTPLGSKVVPPGGPVFGFILSDVLKLCKLLYAQNIKLEATFTQTASVARIFNWGGLYFVKVWWEDVQCTEPPWTYLNIFKPILEQCMCMWTVR